MVNLVGEGATRKYWEFLPERAKRISGAQAYENNAPRDTHSPQAPEDKQASDYRVDTREGWADARGETAEGKPYFDHRRRR